MQTEKSYTETFQMKYGEGDFLGRVRPATLMRCVEHVSLKHADLLGVSRAFTESHHMVFLIAKQGIVFHRMPRADEILTFVTTPEQAKRITYRRVTVIYDVAGEEVARVDSLWVLMDTDTHKLLRHAPVQFDQEWTQAVGHELDLRIPKPKVMEKCGDFTACYTHCDTNGHVNNTNYFDIVSDFLPIECLQTSQVKRMTINYHRELLLGDAMQLQRAVGAEGVYLLGSCNGLATFEAFCTFTE